ncbi:MAG: YdeI/OmpD-associated family protein [Acidimicrobiales bacterium]
MRRHRAPLVVVPRTVASGPAPAGHPRSPPGQARHAGRVLSRWVTQAKRPETRARRLAALMEDSAAPGQGVGTGSPVACTHERRPGQLPAGHALPRRPHHGGCP